MHVVLNGFLPLLQMPQIIVHNTGPDGSLRGAAAAMGINAITIEIGNPQRFHQAFIDRTYKGVINVLSYLNVRFGSGSFPHYMHTNLCYQPLVNADDWSCCSRLSNRSCGMLEISLDVHVDRRNTLCQTSS